MQYVDGRIFAVVLTLLMCGGAPELGHADPLIGGAWLALDVLWAAMSLAVFRHYSARETAFEPRTWRRILGAIWIANAALWGGAVVVFWDPKNAANEAVLFMVILAVMVSYFYTLAASFQILVAAMVTVFAVSWATLLIEGGVLSPVFLMMLPCFFVVLVNYADQAAKKYHTALRLRFENETLATGLRMANQAKSVFLASVSHELRTPLNSILGYSDMIRQRLFGPIAPARYAGYVDDIHTSGTQLLKMINDLLDLAKIESGKREFSFAAVNLNKVAHEAMKLVEPKADRALVNVMIDVKSDMMVRADARAVRQILVNLLLNAINFSRPGGIAVVFCEVTPDEHTRLGVRDTGLGMSSETIRGIFDPAAEDAEPAPSSAARGTRPADYPRSHRSPSGRSENRKHAWCGFQGLGRVPARTPLAQSRRGLARAVSSVLRHLSRQIVDIHRL
ncbi:MAG: HAMP domain-containing histidine kinase [Blastochloris sp.]|nr:HAMP domain-containing histidine kinase [Blastochloris sp.]